MSATPDNQPTDTSGSGPDASGQTLPRSDASDSRTEPAARSSIRFERRAMDNRAQTENLAAIVLGIGIAVVVGFVVLYLANEVMLMTNVSEGDPLYPAHEALTEATNNTFEMFGLLFVIALLSVAIIYLWRAQSAR